MSSRSHAPHAPRPDAKQAASLMKESEEKLQHLRTGGALGVSRPVRVRGAAAFSEDGNARPLVPGEKRIHLVRHGQGYHNLLADVYREVGSDRSQAYLRPEVVDPPLTEKGREQARALHPAARDCAPELVVVSPMVRATQTALIAFEHLLTTKVPFIAHESCHEIAGVHTCDKRMDLSELRRDFPMVDYDTTQIVERDPTWHETRRELPTELADRAYDLMLWIRERPESEIVLVGHSAWLFSLLNAVVECEDEALRMWFMTGEMKSTVLQFED